MNIIEAVKTRKRIKRRGSESSLIPCDYWSFFTEDILADDWEVEEEKVEMTKEQLRSCFVGYAYPNDNFNSFFNALCERIGFKS